MIAEVWKLERSMHEVDEGESQGQHNTKLRPEEYNDSSQKLKESSLQQFNTLIPISIPTRVYIIHSFSVSQHKRIQSPYKRITCVEQNIRYSIRKTRLRPKMI